MYMVPFPDDENLHIGPFYRHSLYPGYQTLFSKSDISLQNVGIHKRLPHSELPTETMKLKKI